METRLAMEWGGILSPFNIKYVCTYLASMFVTAINTEYHNVTVHTHVMYFIHMIVISYIMYSTRQLYHHTIYV